MEYLTTVKLIKIILAVSVTITVFNVTNALSIVTSEEAHGARIAPFNWKTSNIYEVHGPQNA
jgi:hypothetical protein